MEPVASIVTAIFKVLKGIAKAEREAGWNQTRCRDLAQRAQVVSNVLHDAKTAAAAETRRIILCRLKEALDDALKLVESCGQHNNSRRTRLSSWFSARLNSGTRAARFDDVDKRITNCLIELCAASGAFIEKKIDQLAVSARDHHPGTNKPKEIKAGNAPQKCTTGHGRKKRGSRRRRGKKKAAAAMARPSPPDNLSGDTLPTARLLQETKVAIALQKCAIGQGGKNRGSKRRRGKKKMAAVVVARSPPPSVAHVSVHHPPPAP